MGPGGPAGFFFPPAAVIAGAVVVRQLGRGDSSGGIAGAGVAAVNRGDFRCYLPPWVAGRQNRAQTEKPPGLVAFSCRPTSVQLLCALPLPEKMVNGACVGPPE